MTPEAMRTASTLLSCTVMAVLGAATAAATPFTPSVAADLPVAAAGADVLPGPPQRAARMRLPASARVRRVALASPSSAEAAPLAAHNRRALALPQGLRGQPLAIGFPRLVDFSIALRDLPWSTAGNGVRVARLEVSSPAARALRVALALSAPVEGVTLRVAAKTSAQALATFDAATIARSAGTLLTPVVEGDTAVVEIEARSDAELDHATLSVPRLAHLVVGGADLAAPVAAVQRASGIGSAASCNVDAACASSGDPALETLARSAAKLVFVGEGGLSYVCSGTLINDTAATNTPYVLTADHCIDSMAAARSIASFWLFATAACGAQGTQPYVQLTGGATLLGRSQDDDWSLLRLDETPPAGTRLAAWRAEPIAIGTPIVSLHHPRGDLLKANRGTVTGIVPLVDELVDGDFTQVTWASGITEGGSSGGLLATVGMGGYEVRGALYGGLSTCSRPADPDYFSRLETMLPLVREYLTPAAVPSDDTAVAVEFHHALLDRYFLTTAPAEIANLDSGRTVGWARTGLRFLVHANPVPGANPVCRLYSAAGHGVAHFYSASPAECAQTLAVFAAAWLLETPAAFYVPLPDPVSGLCPAGTAPVYRYFNRVTGGHRYTADRVTADAMRFSPTWVAEGYGTGPRYPVMCAVQG